MVRLCRLSTAVIVAEVLVSLQDSYCNLLHILRRARIRARAYIPLPMHSQED